MFFFAVLFLLLALGLGYAGLSLRRAAEAAARWPVTEGQLERCEVVERRDVDWKQPSTWGLGLEYSYRVGGRDYRASRYAFVEMSTQDERAPQLLVERLRAQQPLCVHYDPKDPKSAVLSTQPSDLPGQLAFTCFVLAGISALVTLFVCGAA